MANAAAAVPRPPIALCSETRDVQTRQLTAGHRVDTVSVYRIPEAARPGRLRGARRRPGVRSVHADRSRPGRTHRTNASSAGPRPLNHATLAEQVYQHLRQQILANAYPAERRPAREDPGQPAQRQPGSRARGAAPARRRRAGHPQTAPGRLRQLALAPAVSRCLPRARGAGRRWPSGWPCPI